MIIHPGLIIFVSYLTLMEPFLMQVARYLDKVFGDELEKICIVLPNRRAGLFLRRYLSEIKHDKVIWAPAIFPVEDFFKSFSHLHEAELIPQLFELYRIYHGVNGEKAQPFGQFLEWGVLLLKDFEDVDRNLVDPEAVFSSLSEARALSVWNPDGSPLSDFQREYLEFFQSLKSYHHLFTASLLSSNQASLGMIFRIVAENIGDLKDKMTWKHVVFAGFNALTGAEEKVFNVLHTAGLATFLWDADDYYIKDEVQEAGFYLRKWLNKWPLTAEQPLGLHLGTQKKEITVAGFPEANGQARYCGMILQELLSASEISEKTAVVLPDSAQLFPLLNAIPQDIREINVTSGYPLKNTSLAGFFTDLFTMQINANRMNRANNNAVTGFYYEDILKVLKNPYTALMANGQPDENNLLPDYVADRIRTGFNNFIDMDFLKKEFPDQFTTASSYLEILFIHWNTPERAISGMTGILKNISFAISKLNGSKDFPPVEGNEMNLRFEMEFIASMEEIVFQLAVHMKSIPSEMDVLVLQKLFLQLMGSKSVPFSGEPMKGLQVMGLLETRNLDFENVIILSCNENILPAGKSTDSLIPLDIRQGYNLPVFYNKDAMTAYHFYRLIQRAQKVWLLYITQGDQLGGGDKSRFVRQLVNELPLKNPSVLITEKIVALAMPDKAVTRRIEISKTGNVMEQLLARAEKGYSASSLNNYRNCPLKFYYAEIAEIKEPKDIPDLIDPPVLGNAVHSALHELYKPLINHNLTVEALSELLKIHEKAVFSAFENKIKGSDVMTGRNLLLVNVASLLTGKLIKHDIREQENFNQSGQHREILFLEELIETKFQISTGDQNIMLKIKGFIDRVDKLDNSWRIIDYKTGKAESENVNIKTWEKLISDQKLNIGFQLLLYAFLIFSKYDSVSRLSAGILPLRKIQGGILPLTLPDEKSEDSVSMISRKDLTIFAGILSDLLCEIYNPKLPFVQTTDVERCRICPYINLCSR